MIDLHSHFLPSIDDGPGSLEESLILAGMAVENGIELSIMTPHIHPGRYENQKKNIEQAVDRFRLALKENNISLKLGAAAEVRIGPEILTMVQEDAISFLGEMDGYKILLLEFPHDTIPVGSENLVDWLLKRKIRPMIAHPERNREIMRDLTKIIPYVTRGCLLQITAASIANRFSEQATIRAKEMLEQDWVHIIATDAHDVQHRPPDLASGRDAAAKIVGIDEANKLVVDNPGNIVGASPSAQ